MPADAQNGKYGFIREVSLLEYQDSKSYACKFLTNCEESATTVYVDNEYFNRGSDKFGNPWRNSVTLGTSIEVDVERIYGRYPKNIYGTNGNNGTQSVTVTLNGVELTDKIIIDYNNVTNGVTFENSEGLNSNDEVVFTFTDYYWYGQWSTTPITYRATATLGEIYDGTTLEFRAQGEINKITTIDLSEYTLTVNSVQRDNVNGQNYYPEVFNNNNSSIEAKVYYKDEDKGTITIQRGNNNTYTITKVDVEPITDSNGVDGNIEIVFNSEYRVRTGWGSSDWNGTPERYTATITVEQLLNNGGAALSFTR